MNGSNRMNRRGGDFSSRNQSTTTSPAYEAGSCSLPKNEQALIREFMQALAEEIEAIKRGGGGSIITVYDGKFIRREGPFWVYSFSTESPLIVMDDAPAEVEVGRQRFSGQIISVQGSEVAVGIEHDFGNSISEARLITNLWYLLESLRKRYEEVLAGQRVLQTGLPQKLFGLATPTSRIDDAELNLPPWKDPPNEEQQISIRAACGSDIHFIWGPPGTGKTQTIGFLVAALLRRNLRVLVVSHTNVATDNAIEKVAKLLEATEDYQSGKLVRFGNISPNSVLPEMVIPEKIAERLGKHLKDELVKHQTELSKIQLSLAEFGKVQTLLTQRNENIKKLSDLETNLQRSIQEQQNCKQRTNELTNQLNEAKNKMTEAQAAGKLKRLFLGLDPVKLQTKISRIESDLVVLQNTTSARIVRQNQLQASIKQATDEKQRCAKEAQTLLSNCGLSEEGLSARIEQLAKQAEELGTAIRTIEQELQAILAKVLRDAKVIATSLTKATISKQMDDQKFDVVVIDEASMSPMPSLYFAVGRAAQKAIVVGDFRQLPPICIADTAMVEKWLARDIFSQAGIQQAVDAGQTEPRLTLLRRQYRMHPDISSVSNSIIYNGRLVDSLSQIALDDLGSFLSRSPFGTNPLVLYDVSSTNPWSSRLQQGGRYNLYSAVLSAELAKRAALSGIENIGVISPYSIHARLIKMILDDTKEADLRHLKVSTVHKFQGLEQDVIIFDIAEGPMPRYGPSGLVDGVDLESQAAKLINVSITRPRAQIVIVANVDYLTSKLRSDSILLRVLAELRQRGAVIDSQEIVDNYFCADFERWASLLDPHNDQVNPDDSTLYTERNFYAACFTDLRSAIREIIIVSPFLTATRAQQFFNLFRSKVAEGIEVRVFTKPQSEQQGDMIRQAEMVFGELKRIGVQVVERKGLHQKFAFIDRQVAWEGSLNILSQSEGRSTEHMRRLPFAKTCEELIDLHKFGSDAEVEPGSRQPVQTDRKCEKCSSPKVLVRGPQTIFLGCMDYPKCQCKPEFIRQGQRILTDAICPGKNAVACSERMYAVTGRNGVYLKCFNPNCGATRNIKT